MPTQPTVARLAALAADTSLQSDPAARERAVLEVVDAVGCAVRGASHPALDRARAALSRWPGGGSTRSLVLAPGQRHDLAQVLALEALACHIDEFDSIHPASATAPASVCIPAAWILGAHLDIAGARLVDAVLAGYQVMTQASMLFGAGMLYERSLWPTAVFGGLSAAAVAGVLLDLDLEQQTHALALAAGSLGGLLSADELGDGHYLLAADACVDGVRAAYRAQAGARASWSLLDAPAGRVLGRPPAPVETQPARASVLDCEIKAYPCARPLQAVIEALRTLQHDGLDLDRIEHVAVGLPAPVLRFVNAETIVTGPPEAAASAVHAVVSVQEGRSDDPTFYRAADLRGRPVPAVDLHADAELSLAYPRRWGAHVTVRSLRGETQEAVSFGPDPVDLGDAVRTKLLRNLATAMTTADVERVHDLLRGVDRAASVRTLRNEVLGLLS